MSRLFDDTASERLDVSSAPVTDYPLSMACWFRMDAPPSTIERFSFCMIDNGTNFISLAINNDPDRDIIVSIDGQNNGVSAGGGAQNPNQWYHACGVYASATDRAIFLDGANKGTDTTSRAFPTSADSMEIGDNTLNSGFSPMDGRICELACWNATLTDEEVAVLGRGFSPLFIQPQNLVFYAPMVRDEDVDIVGGLTLTPINVPGTDIHVPIIYPPPIVYPWITAVGGPTDFKTVAGTLNFSGALSTEQLAKIFRIY